jgi:hypothetical protein
MIRFLFLFDLLKEETGGLMKFVAKKLNTEESCNVDSILESPRQAKVTVGVGTRRGGNPGMVSTRRKLSGWFLFLNLKAGYPCGLPL